MKLTKIKKAACLILAALQLLHPIQTYAAIEYDSLSGYSSADPRQKDLETYDFDDSDVYVDHGERYEEWLDENAEVNYWLHPDDRIMAYDLDSGSGAYGMKLFTTLMTMALGFSVSSASNLINRFMAWASRNDTEAYETGVSVMGATMGMTITGIKYLLKSMTNWFTSTTKVDGGQIVSTDYTSLSSAINDVALYNGAVMVNHPDLLYLGTYSVESGTSFIYYYDIYVKIKGLDANQIGIPVIYKNSNSINYAYAYMSGNTLTVKSGQSLFRVTTSYNLTSDSWKYNSNYSTYGGLDMPYLDFSIPVFNSSENASNYLLYGKTYGLLNTDSVQLADINKILATKDKVLNVADSFTVESDNEIDMDTLLSQYTNAQTLADAIQILLGGKLLDEDVPAYEITDNEYQRMLRYCIQKTAIKYGGKTIDYDTMDDIIDGLYAELYQSSSASRSEKSRQLMKDFVVINGGKSIPPNQDDDKNSFKYAAAFSTALLSALVLTGSVPDIGVGTDPDEEVNPDPGGSTDPDPGTDPDDKPGTILGIDYTEWLRKIWEKIPSLDLDSLIGRIITAINNFKDAVIEKLQKIIDPDPVPDPAPDASPNPEDPQDSSSVKWTFTLLSVPIILIMLLIIFINAMRFIVLIYAIPASSALLPDDMVAGLNYLKSIQLPLFGIGLYQLLLSACYFILFSYILRTLRKRIDQI